MNQEEGTAQFYDFREDEYQMGLLFQQFVKTFCEREDGLQGERAKDRLVRSGGKR